MSTNLLSTNDVKAAITALMSTEKLIIIDYGSGNLASAEKSLRHAAKDNNIDVEITISNKADDILKADRLVLPGQGAFRDCKENLDSVPGMIEALEQRVLKDGKPFLGICVGMQLLATRGLEHGVTAGLNWIEGEVVPIEPDDETLKIPHMGWNELYYHSANDAQDNRHLVLRSTESSENFYFVHSFMFKCLYNRHCLAMTNYGGSIPAVVGRDNIIGMQFHPEKSHDAGLRLLANFLEWKP